LKKKILGHRPSLRSQLLGAIGRNGVKWPKRIRICFYLAKHLKTVLGTRKNHRNLNRTFGEGVDNYTTRKICIGFMHNISENMEKCIISFVKNAFILDIFSSKARAKYAYNHQKNIHIFVKIKALINT
jgi:hypothetical protein